MASPGWSTAGLAENPLGNTDPGCIECARRHGGTEMNSRFRFLCAAAPLCEALPVLLENLCARRHDGAEMNSRFRSLCAAAPPCETLPVMLENLCARRHDGSEMNSRFRFLCAAAPLCEALFGDH